MISQIMALAVTSTILIVIPGPSIMFLIGQAIAVGRSNALRAVIGNAVGMLLIALILSIGVGNLIEKSIAILFILKLVGAVVLLTIGLRYIFTQPDLEITSVGEEKKATSLFSGMIVGLTNPKALIMFGVIVPGYVPIQASNPTTHLLLLSMIPIVLGIIIDSLWVLLASKLTNRLISNRIGIRIIYLIGGVLIIAMALILVLESMLLF